MKLTRRDLRGFDRMAQDLVLEAQSHGMYVRLSNRGHVIIRSRNGATAAVGKDMNSYGRNSQNARSQVNKLIADHLRF